MFGSRGCGMIGPVSQPGPSRTKSAGSNGFADARDDQRGVVLLRGVEPVGELVVHPDAVDLRRRLVHLRRPRAPAVERHVGAAVVRLDHGVAVLRIDPDVVIVAVRRAQRRRTSCRRPSTCRSLRRRRTRRRRWSDRRRASCSRTGRVDHRGWRWQRRPGLRPRRPSGRCRRPAWLRSARRCDPASPR